MIKKMKNAFYAVLAIVLLLPAIVVAQYSSGSAPSGMPSTGNVNELIIKIINWFLTFLASLSVLMIVVAGIMYITSGGDETRVENAKRWLTYAIVGLIVALLGYLIVRTVSGALGAG